MNKIAEGFSKFGGFLGDVRGELKKCTWPTRPELLESTGVVVVSILLVGIYVGLSDKVIIEVLNVIIR